MTLPFPDGIKFKLTQLIFAPCKKRVWGVTVISEDLVNYIKELDFAFSRLIYRLGMLIGTVAADQITGTQFIVLRILRKAPSNTTRLARALGVTLSAVTALVNRLDKMGLVTRERKKEDRRQVWIRITSRGRHILDEAEDKRHLFLALYFTRFSEEERAQLLATLRRVNELFDHRETAFDEESGHCRGLPAGRDALFFPPVDPDQPED